MVEIVTLTASDGAKVQAKKGAKALTHDEFAAQEKKLWGDKLTLAGYKTQQKGQTPTL